MAMSVTATLWGRAGDQCLHFRGGLEPELIIQQRLVPNVLAPGLGVISFGQIRADQNPLATFPQGLTSNGREAGFNRLAKPMPDCEALAQVLKRVQAKLPEPFAFHQHPVVVPVSQQVSGYTQQVATRVIAIG